MKIKLPWTDVVRTFVSTRRVQSLFPGRRGSREQTAVPALILTVAIASLTWSVGCVEQGSKNASLVTKDSGSGCDDGTEPSQSDDLTSSKFTSDDKAAFKAALGRDDMEAAEEIYESLDRYGYQVQDMVRLVDHYACRRLTKVDPRTATPKEIIDILEETHDVVTRVEHAIEVRSYFAELHDLYLAMAINATEVQLAQLWLSDQPVPNEVFENIRRCKALPLQSLPNTQKAYKSYEDMKAIYLK